MAVATGEVVWELPPLPPLQQPLRGHPTLRVVEALERATATAGAAEAAAEERGHLTSQRKSLTPPRSPTAGTATGVEGAGAEVGEGAEAEVTQPQAQGRVTGLVRRRRNSACTPSRKQAPQLRASRSQGPYKITLGITPEVPRD